MRGLPTRLAQPVSGGSLRMFRVALGLILCVSSVRFVLNGWVARFYVEPTFFFSYRGFGWVHPLSESGMTAAFLALAVLAALIAVPRTSRLASGLFFLGFSYVELIDATNYLNHYYLVSLLTFLLAVIPDGREIPRWGVWILRLQIGVVYTFAALAKATPDWLVHAQPLNLWMSARTETLFVGPMLDGWLAALAMSWAGFLSDLLAPWLLSWKRTRLPMYATVVVFHTLTAVFFTIGIFPILMVCGATLFFPPDWPDAMRRGAKARLKTPKPRRALSPIAMTALVAFATWQTITPLRWVAYGGDVNWHEQGMRWAWKVMCREKNGSITYTVRTPEGRERLVFPEDLLTAHQAREFSGQPDMIVQLGQHIGESAPGDVEVYVDALVSLNGRRAAPIIDPTADLMEIELGAGGASWILPAPTEAPPRLRVR